MTQQIENEFKTLLTLNEYTTLLKSFTIGTKIEQTNYYFDTPQFDLNKQKIGLRLRKLTQDKTTFEQTLKIPVSNFITTPGRRLTEITDYLTEQEFTKIISTKNIKFSHDVGTQLTQLRVNNFEKIMIIATSITERTILVKMEDQKFSFIVDRTVYQDGSSDYELEIENKNANIIQEIHKNLTTTFALKSIPVVNKRDRAVEHRIKPLSF